MLSDELNADMSSRAIFTGDYETGLIDWAIDQEMLYVNGVEYFWQGGFKERLRVFCLNELLAHPSYCGILFGLDGIQCFRLL